MNINYDLHTVYFFLRRIHFLSRQFMGSFYEDEIPQCQPFPKLLNNSFGKDD